MRNPFWKLWSDVATIGQAIIVVVLILLFICMLIAPFLGDSVPLHGT